MTRNFLAAALLALFTLGCVSHTAVASSALEFKTAAKEIQGTREVEAGNFEEGIARLEKALKLANLASEKAPVLVNLCVAYAASQALEKASEYCDQSVKNGVDLATAYNNRAVLNMMQGNVEAGVADLEKAALVRPSNGLVKRNLARVQASRGSQSS